MCTRPDTRRTRPPYSTCLKSADTSSKDHRLPHNRRSGANAGQKTGSALTRAYAGTIAEPWSPRYTGGDGSTMPEIFTDGTAAGQCVPVGQRRSTTPKTARPRRRRRRPIASRRRAGGVGLWASQTGADFSRRATYGFLRYRERTGVEHTRIVLCQRGRSQMSGRKLRWPGLGLGGDRRQHPGLRVQRDGPALVADEPRPARRGRAVT
jgi:hypothetical protein